MSNLLDDLKKINPYKNYSHDDKGLGELFADIYKDKCRYNTTTKSWFIYDGTRWIKDEANMKVSRYAKQLSKYLYLYANKIEYSKDKPSYIRFVGKLGSLSKRKTMIEDARDKYAISNEKLDTNDYLFNCKNGTYNLKNFTLQPHNPNDFISKISNVFYNENTKSTKFHKFIEEIMEGNTAKIEYLQKILGYSLTGDTRYEEFYIFHGPTTRNGKTTLIEAFSNSLGNTNGYAVSINSESLANKHCFNGSSASGDIAKLQGYRFVNANEAPQNMFFNVNLLKKLTGQDMITARYLYQEEFDFKPSLKLFFNTNHLPMISDDTLFTSNRVHVITFNKHFSENEQNKNLKIELMEIDTVSEIFNWSIEGLKKVNLEGLIAPQEVVQDTKSYQEVNDKIAIFISECLKRSEKNETGQRVYEIYKTWSEENGYVIENKSSFFLQLKSKNILHDHGTVRGKTYRNIIKNYEITSKGKS